MMELTNTSLLLCGLPESGKSTFLGALAYLISSEEIDIPLRENGLPANREYIDKIADLWSSFQVIDRTRIEDFHDVEFLLSDELGEFTLLAPDLSGETWESDVCDNRRCSEKLADHAKEATGILLFLHAENLKKPVPLNALIDDLGKEAKKETIDVQPWEPNKHLPTQSSAVDLLQLLSQPPLGGGKKRVSIILSAWDLVMEQNLTPDKYLEDTFPLLYQYLQAGFDYPEWKIFGISALGGDLDTDRQALLEKDNASERIIVNDIGNHDLSLPIRWALKR